MRRISIFLSLCVTVGLLLAACSPSLSETGTPGANNGLQPGAEVTGTPGAQPLTGNQNGAYPVTGTPELSTGPTATSPAQPKAEPNQKAPPAQAVDRGLLSHQMQFQVVDQQNQVLGQVKDFVLDLTNLKVAYVIVSGSQTTQATTKLVAVPWAMLKLQDSSTAAAEPSTKQTGGAQGAFVFSGDPKLLANAPEFSADSLPQLGLPAGNWDASILSYWNGAGSGSANTPSEATPTASANASPTSTPEVKQSSTETHLQGVALASKVVGFSIKDSNNKEIAKVMDAVVDVNTGAITYLILAATNIPGLNNKLIPVPLQDLGLDMQNLAVIIQVGPDVLLKAPSFDQGNFPQTTTTGWDSQVKSFWQSQMPTTTQP